MAGNGALEMTASIMNVIHAKGRKDIVGTTSVRVARNFKKVGETFLGAMSFYLGYTLWRITQEIKKKQKIIDERWEDATNEHAEEGRESDTMHEMSRRVSESRGRFNSRIASNSAYDKSPYWNGPRRDMPEAQEGRE